MYDVAIIQNETRLDHLPWINACRKKPDLIKFDVIDITSSDWIDYIKKKDYQIFLLRAPGRIERFKKLYDERIYILSQVLHKKVYPSPEEIYLYENKSLIRDWLIANNIPHPKSFAFYHEDDALNFIEQNRDYPLVAKTKIGASGAGVVFLDSKRELEKYIMQAFSTGVKIRSGPKLNKGSYITKIKKVLSNKEFLKQRLDDYRTMASEVQKGMVFIQEFIPHSYEWRCIRIGDSYFAHKKIAKNNKASGTLIKGYDPVPVSLLDFINDITNKTSLFSTSIDVFETGDKYLVNEIQCFFGQSDPYQMLVNGKQGRYRIIDGQWFFEEGDYARNFCYDLRLDHALSLI